MGYKQVIIVRTDLKMPKGKTSAQVAHAAVEAVLRSDPSIVRMWRDEGMPKIVLKVDDEKALIKALQDAKDSKLKTALITDAGRTCVSPGTKTCVAVGPDLEEKIDVVFSKYKLL